MTDPKRRKLRRRALFAAPVAAAGLTSVIALWLADPARDPNAPPRAAPSPPPVSVAEPSAAKTQPKPVERPKKRRLVRIDWSAANPVHVAIPAAGIAASVIPLGLRSDGSLEVPRDFSKAGWRTGGPEPGERGAAVIAGHVDSKSGPAAFYRLREVTPGSEIEVRRGDGTTVTFVARRTEQVAKDHFPTRRVYRKTRLPTLRLVTCGSFDTASGHYRDNLIVYASRKPS